MLRQLKYVSPNAAECMALAAAVRRKRRMSSTAGGEAAAADGAVVQLTQGGSSAGAAESARDVVDRLLPSVQALLEVTAAQRSSDMQLYRGVQELLRTPLCGVR